MHKHLIRLLLGGALLYASLEFMQYANWYYDLATGGPLKTTNPLNGIPPGAGDDDFFDRPDPLDYIKTDESKGYQAAGLLRLRAGQLCFLAGSVLVLLGLLPIAFRFLSWLILPDSVRHALTQPEAPPCTTAAP